MAKKIRLKIVSKPDPATTTILSRGDIPNRDPFIISEGGSYNLVCGSCEFMLARNVEFVQIKQFVFHCPKCKRYNVSD